LSILHNSKNTEFISDSCSSSDSKRNIYHDISINSCNLSQFTNNSYSDEEQRLNFEGKNLQEDSVRYFEITIKQVESGKIDKDEKYLTFVNIKDVS
jgi:hypothetical protein